VSRTPQKVTCVAASPWLASAPTAHAQIRQICTGHLSMVPEIQLTVVSQSADLHFFVWLEPVQPEQCRYQRNALTPTLLTYTRRRSSLQPPAIRCARCRVLPQRGELPGDLLLPDQAQSSATEEGHFSPSHLSLGYRLGWRDGS